MIQYLIIMLDDTSASYCHYNNPKTKQKLISTEDLTAGIRFAMKENLMIQFVYPGYDLPQKYKQIIETIDHSKVVPVDGAEEADVMVLEDWNRLSLLIPVTGRIYVLRTATTDFLRNYAILKELAGKMTRLNIVLTDVPDFTTVDIGSYRLVLNELADDLARLYQQGITPQLNVLTDRMMLDKMNNCNAGWESITLAPNGKFYVCPAFYHEDESDSIGDLTDGLRINNPQLYRLAYAPLCRECDAYQCKRCVWLNRKLTLEVNTPSHEQCVISHLERNASRVLLLNIREYGTFLPEHEIREINYLDPFEVRNEQ